jgi:pyruvate kinase
MQQRLAGVAPELRASARNLVHYVALRQEDLRPLQAALARQGLSSLGRAESCVLGSVLQASARAHEALALRGDASARRQARRLAGAGERELPWEAAQSRLHANARTLLGPRPLDRQVSIMVTAPLAAEADEAWMARLLEAGMNVLRINCAHGDQREWGALVAALGAARARTGRPCQVLMDLAGPKIRTGPLAEGRRVVTWKPTRDDVGAVTAPARVVVRRASAGPGGEPGPFLRLSDQDFARVRRGDGLHLDDASHRRRTLLVDEVSADQLVLLATQRASVLDGATVGLARAGRRRGVVRLEVAGDAPGAIDVRVGDPLVLTSRRTTGRAPRRLPSGRVSAPGRIACTLPQALERLGVGHRVMFDDGRIEAVVARKLSPGRFELEVRRTHKRTSILRAEKGINLPDTPMAVPSLSEEDVAALTFVAEHADAVSLSFVSRPADLRRLRQELDRLGRPALGVVLKIETRAGFERLPSLLLEGLRRPPLGVMIARGDLAVEVGFERLAEVQEEILWLCEASHTPAIWATQVLDTLARTGAPSRAEVTDASASVAAECVMLNKGPFVDRAVVMLADILRRMETHHDKKRSLFRRLGVSTFA